MSRNSLYHFFENDYVEGVSRHQQELSRAFYEDTDKARWNRERLAHQARIDRENEQLKLWEPKKPKK